MLNSLLGALGLRRGPATGGPEEYFAKESSWVPVVSSNVAAVAHFSPVAKGQVSTQPILGVRFKDGAEYWYYGVPLGVWINMAASTSKGRFVWQSLRDRYVYRRVK